PRPPSNLGPAVGPGPDPGRRPADQPADAPGGRYPALRGDPRHLVAQAGERRAHAAALPVGAGRARHRGSSVAAAAAATPGTGTEGSRRPVRPAVSEAMDTNASAPARAATTVLLSLGSNLEPE